jgi:hypothetical protein
VRFVVDSSALMAIRLNELERESFHAVLLNAEPHQVFRQDASTFPANHLPRTAGGVA